MAKKEAFTKRSGELLSLCILVALVRAIYRLLRDPLADIPGPFLNRVSIWPLRFATIKGRRMYYVDELHQQYGPLVRISPEEVSVSDVKSVKEIHKIGNGFLKAPWYAKFTQESSGSNSQEDLGIFAMRDPKVHSVRRKLFARGFSAKGLEAYEGIIQRKVKMTMDGISRSLQQEGKADILAWLTFMANDTMATLAFGSSLGNLERGTKDSYINDLENVMMITGIAAELSWLSPILNRFSPRNRLDVTGRKMVERGLAGLGTNETIFSKMLGQGENDTLTIDQISREASNLLVAGSDTTARTTTYLIWAILADADQSIRQRIVAEVNGLEDNFSVQDALALPFLSMCIQETLRLYGAAPGALPRTTPKEGAVFQGKMVPGGCVVSTQAYTLHRNPDVFPEPLVYKPDRWASPTQDMKDAYMPFGGGTRVCIGMHLAHMELAVATASFFRTFSETVTLAAETTPESMEMENFFLAGPKSHRCIIQI